MLTDTGPAQLDPAIAGALVAVLSAITLIDWIEPAGGRMRIELRHCATC